MIDSKTEKGISTLCVNIFLPCLLFTQIGPLATPSNLQSYWIIVVLSLLYQVISWVFGVIGVKLFGFSEWLIPCMIFNNATSLPLLLLQSLGKIGTLKNLVQDGDSMDEVLRRGKVYLLINALVANLVRFAVGPYMLNQAEEKSDQHQEPRQESTDRPSLRRYDSVSAASYQQGEDEDGEANETTGLLERLGERTTSSKPWKKTRDISAKVLGFTNPPVWAGLLAILVGVIPFLRHALFDDTGALSAFEQSIDNLGQLYTALQTLILGSQLKSKAGSRPPTGTLAYLFLYRFFVVTAISCGLVYGSRKVLGEYMKKDPVLVSFMLLIVPSHLHNLDSSP